MNDDSEGSIAEQGDQGQVFIASWWRQLLYVLFLDLPPLGVGMMFLSLLAERSTCSQETPNIIFGVAGTVIAFGIFFLWVATCHEKIVLTPTELVRISVLGRKGIPLSEIVSARCGFQGRGNTLLVVETTRGRRRMGMSLSTKEINELAEILNSRSKQSGSEAGEMK